MAYAGADWTTVDSFNRLPFSYDFSKRVGSGDAIIAATFLLEMAPIEAYPSTDPNPASHIYASDYSGAVATVWLTDLMPRCRYKLVAFVETASGVRDDLWAYVSCDPAP